MSVKQIIFVIPFLFCGMHLYAQQKTVQQTDPAIERLQQVPAPNILHSKNIDDILKKIKVYSGLGGVYDDTAQQLIYKVARMNETLQDDTINYYLQIFQTEIFYYAGLYQFGILSAEKQIERGYKVKDSFLIGSAYFFKAINLLELDSLDLTKTYLDTALAFYPLHKPTVDYRKLAYHNQLVNVYAETFFKQKKYDKAIYYNNLALNEAYTENSKRGIPAGHLVQGKIFLALQKNDSANYHFNKTIESGNAFNHYDLVLAAYGKQMLINGSRKEISKNYLQKGLQLIEQKVINNFLKVSFYNDAIVFSKMNGDGAAIQMLQSNLLDIKEKDAKASTELVQNITTQMINNENNLLNLQVNAANQKQKLSNTRLMLALIAFACTVIGFVVYRYFQKQKMTILKVRQKISQDLHDDVGSSLSSIQIFSELANTHWETKPEETRKSVFKIATISKDLMHQMSDIVWSMKPPEEETNSFSARIKNYAANFLTPLQISCMFTIDEQLTQKITNPATRRSLLLITKEAINNIAKYSKAKNCIISFKKEDNVLFLTIKDDGKGFNPDTVRPGNGLQHIENRCKQLGGNFKIDTGSNKGVFITCRLPIAIFSH